MLLSILLGIIYLFQNGANNAILEYVSVAKTIVWCKTIIQKTFIFQCSKIYANQTR